MDYLYKLMLLSELDEKLYGKEHWYLRINQMNYRKAMSKCENCEEDIDIPDEPSEKSLLLNYIFFEQYDLIQRAKQIWLYSDNVEYVESNQLVDALVNAQTEEVRRCRILAEKEAELFYDKNDDYCENRIALEREEENLRNDKIIKLIEDEWIASLDRDFNDRWFAERYQDFVHYCNTKSLGEYSLFFDGLDFHGKCLDWEFDVPNSYYCLDGKKLEEGDISIPFDEHNIWDAVLLYLSVGWLSDGPRIYMVIPVIEEREIYPRVTVHGEMAFAMFCATTRQSNEYRSGKWTFVDMYAVLLQKCGNSFKIVGGYKFDYGKVCVALYFEMPSMCFPSSIVQNQKPLTPEEIEYRSKHPEECNDDIPF